MVYRLRIGKLRSFYKYIKIYYSGAKTKTKKQKTKKKKNFQKDWENK